MDYHYTGKGGGEEEEDNNNTSKGKEKASGQQFNPFVQLITRLVRLKHFFYNF